MAAPTTPNQYPPSDLHRAIDQLTALKTRLEYHQRQAEGGASVAPDAFRELQEIVDRLAAILIHSRNGH